jgi:DNA-binding transcriptional LysR family regulator
LPWVLAKYRKRWPEFNFRVRTGLASAMLSELRQGDIDIVMAMSLEEPTDARHVWLDQLAWGRSDATAIDPSQPVAMLAFNDECRCYRAGVASLQEAGREHRLVMTAPTMMALCAGVDAGLGTVVMTRGRMRMTTLTRWDDAPLPPLPQMHVGIYVRGGADTEPLNDLADEFVPLLRPKPDDADSKSGEYQVVQAAFAQVASSLKKVAN